MRPGHANFHARRRQCWQRGGKSFNVLWLHRLKHQARHAVRVNVAKIHPHHWANQVAVNGAGALARIAQQQVALHLLVYLAQRVATAAVLAALAAQRLAHNGFADAPV